MCEISETFYSEVCIWNLVYWNINWFSLLYFWKLFTVMCCILPYFLSSSYRCIILSIIQCIKGPKNGEWCSFDYVLSLESGYSENGILTVINSHIKGIFNFIILASWNSLLLPHSHQETTWSIMSIFLWYSSSHWQISQ